MVTELFNNEIKTEICSPYRIDIIKGPGPDFDEAYALIQSTFTDTEPVIPKSIMERNMIETSYENKNSLSAVYRAIVVRNPVSNDIIGVSLFYFIRAPIYTEGGPAMLCGIYITTSKEYRGNGVFKTLLTARQKYVDKLLIDHKTVYPPQSKVVLINDFYRPETLTAGEFLADAQSTGMTPADRELMWRRKGYMRLDLNYQSKNITDTQIKKDSFNMCGSDLNKISSLDIERFFRHHYWFSGLTDTLETTNSKPILDMVKNRSYIDLIDDSKYIESNAELINKAAIEMCKGGDTDVVIEVDHPEFKRTSPKKSLWKYLRNYKIT